MVQEHLAESKKKIVEFADKLLLNKDDLEVDNRMFAPLLKKLENVTLSEYLIDLANERIENLEVLVSDKEVIKNYKKELILFLQNTVRERL